MLSFKGVARRLYNRTSPKRRKDLYGEFDVVIVCPGITKYMDIVPEDNFLKNLSKAVEKVQGRPLRPGGNLRVWTERGVLFIDPRNVTSKQLILVIGDLATKYDNKLFMFWGRQAATYATRVHNLNTSHYVTKCDTPASIGCDREGLANSLMEAKNLFPFFDWSN